MSIEVIRPGLQSSIQDLGRYGYQKHGVIVGGAMDTFSMRIANILIGNDEGEAALEITIMGPALKFSEDKLIAITGGDLSPIVDGESIPMWRPVLIKRGSILEFGACTQGCRAYLAVAGGFNVYEVMNSKSTYLRAGIGGFQGRAIAKGDIITTNTISKKSSRLIKQLSMASTSKAFLTSSWFFGRNHLPQEGKAVVIRVIRGIQFDYFSEESIYNFFNREFKVTIQSDRMGYRLSGELLRLKESLEMISEAVSLGTIQVPPDGSPIILLADRQTVGGYPKIAQAANVDIAVIGQLKPESLIVFQEISLKEAEILYIEREQLIQDVKAAVDGNLF
ncbi:biotin-dependent carboxyltransferase family protein [Dendrosporobacter sp. 1207_IL3150]|uniref:5-oxoprolinase subunit C family protein n=1 Tax=Dendrosporobacter sp. 1207_IL3150 TaxID=3084054 RepID=UPI002FDA77C6